MIVLTAYAKFSPDHLDAAIVACRTIRGHSVSETGCERYEFFQSPDEPSQVVFVEEWTTRGHLDTHFEQAAFKHFIATIGPLLERPPEIKIFESTVQG